MKKKLFIISLIIFAIVGSTLFLVGGVLAGWDIIGWFGSSYAIWCYVLGALWLLFWFLFWMAEKIKKL